MGCKQIWKKSLLSIMLLIRAEASTIDDIHPIDCQADESGECINSDLENASPEVPMPASCRLVMAESSIREAGWGVYTMISLPRGAPVFYGDVVIQVPDLNHTHANGMRFLLHDYMWESPETGGQYEGKHVSSMVPGIGMLTNGHETQSNVLPYRPQIDEADLPRTTSPGAGAITHYHNYSFYVQHPLTAGTEVFLNYGKRWVGERRQRLRNEEVVNQRPIASLLHSGLCLDNISPGRSIIPDAGRGAFATRYLKRGSVVAPVPLAPITKRSALHISRVRQAGTPGKPDVLVQGHQLLLNYCFGHRNSSLILYPYSPLVNLINHNSSQANTKLRWSTSNLNRGRDWLDWPLDDVKQLNRPGLLMEFVATRDISPKEEILIDYGESWEQSWNLHSAKWKSPPFAKEYTPAYVMDDVVSVLRTEVEQRSHPYPDNLFTSCFYRFGDHKDEALAASNDHGETTAFKWKMSRGLFDFENLRPCSVLQHSKTPDGNDWYTVRIRNRYGMAPEERIPKGMMHIVTLLPRNAIQFSDKIYTTDQHLENAFRHEIGIPDSLFPEQWMDLT